MWRGGRKGRRGDTRREPDAFLQGLENLSAGGDPIPVAAASVARRLRVLTASAMPSPTQEYVVNKSKNRN